jgi:hypothetical protein
MFRTFRYSGVTGGGRAGSLPAGGGGAGSRAPCMGDCGRGGLMVRQCVLMRTITGICGVALHGVLAIVVGVCSG